MQGQPPPV